MIKLHEESDWDYHGENTLTLTLKYPKSDRYCVNHYILPLIRLICLKRSNEEQIQKLMTELLDDCMRDYYGELKERV